MKLSCCINAILSNTNLFLNRCGVACMHPPCCPSFQNIWRVHKDTQHLPSSCRVGRPTRITVVLFNEPKPNSGFNRLQSTVTTISTTEKTLIITINLGHWQTHTKKMSESPCGNLELKNYWYPQKCPHCCPPPTLITFGQDKKKAAINMSLERAPTF